MQPGSGSLVVAIPCERGLAIAADRLVTDGNGTVLFNTTKIVGLPMASGWDNKAIVAVVGSPFVVDDECDGKVTAVWGVAEEIQKSFDVSVVTQNDAGSLRVRLCEYLLDSYNGKDRDIEISEDQWNHVTKPGGMFKLRIWCSEADSTIVVSTAEFRLDSSSRHRPVLVLDERECGVRVVQKLSQSAIVDAIGECKVWTCIKFKNTPASQKMRSGPFGQRLRDFENTSDCKLFANTILTEARGVSVNRALRFARDLIVLTHDWQASTGSGQVTVGTDVDCAVLDVQDGTVSFGTSQN